MGRKKKYIIEMFGSFTEPFNLWLNETFVSDCGLHGDIYISQGSVATHLRCDEPLMVNLLHDLC